MKEDRVGRLTRLLGGLSVLLVMVIGFGLFLFLSGREKPVEQADAQAAAEPEAQSDALANAGDFLPDLTAFYQVYDADLRTMDGATVSLSSLRGQPVALFFWSSWCSDCKAYFTYGDHFAQSAAAIEASGARFYMVCREGVRGETAESAKACLSEYGLAYDTLLDPDAALFKQLGLHWVPTFAFLSSDGALMCATNDMLQPMEAARYAAYVAGGARDQTADFIRQIMRESGGVPCEYSRDAMGLVSPSDVYMAETQGIVMDYAATVGDRALFERAHAYVADALTVDGLCAWRSERGENAQSNATLDDLRIIGALLAAQERWGGYEQEIALREQALWRRVVVDDMLRDHAALGGGNVAGTTTLCYLDVDALDALAAYRPRWQAVADKARALLEGGFISASFPLYYPRYDAELGIYTGSSVKMSEAMLAVLSAVKAGVAREETLDFLERMLAAGPIYAAYDLHGNPEADAVYESTATYAVIVRVGVAAGRKDLARAALARMERMRQFDGALYGCYGQDGTETRYTFDDLQALMAWTDYIGKAW